MNHNISPPKIIIGSGGTGGHIYPGIAIANELKKKFQKLIFCLLDLKIIWKCEKSQNGDIPLKKFGFQVEKINFFLYQVLFYLSN
ncbi:glycosyltransferase [Blattabacterium cuenoti]|uniref:glycosyltransferase n=1 Tax=Blattabacterium cuenoti TaxID=1653831 RepID=UPI0023790C65|nr:glycosyltransferase [Blattabacterium cuenoti]